MFSFSRNRCLSGAVCLPPLRVSRPCPPALAAFCADILISAMVGLFMLINVILSVAMYQSIAGVPNVFALILFALAYNMLHLAMAAFLGVHPSAIALGFIITIAVCTWVGMDLYGLCGDLIGIAVVTIPSVRTSTSLTLQKSPQI